MYKYRGEMCVLVWKSTVSNFVVLRFGSHTKLARQLKSRGGLTNMATSKGNGIGYLFMMIGLEQKLWKAKRTLKEKSDSLIITNASIDQLDGLHDHDFQEQIIEAECWAQTNMEIFSSGMIDVFRPEEVKKIEVPVGRFLPT